MEKLYYTAKEVAEMLDVSVSHPEAGGGYYEGAYKRLEKI